MSRSRRRRSSATFPSFSRRRWPRLRPARAASIVDGTFGAGGYARALLARGAQVIALDRDPPAVRAGAALWRLRRAGGCGFVEGRFGDLDAIARRSASRRLTASCSTSAFPRCSSTRRRAASRCASTRRSTCGWRRTGRTAADILRDDDEETIADILFHFGEERAARRIARAIVADRDGDALRLDAPARADDRARRAGAARRD